MSKILPNLVGFFIAILLFLFGWVLFLIGYYMWFNASILVFLISCMIMVTFFGIFTALGICLFLITQETFKYTEQK